MILATSLAVSAEALPVSVPPAPVKVVTAAAFKTIGELVPSTVSEKVTDPELTSSAVKAPPVIGAAAVATEAGAGSRVVNGPPVSEPEVAGEPVPSRLLAVAPVTAELVMLDLLSYPIGVCSTWLATDCALATRLCSEVMPVLAACSTCTPLPMPSSRLEISPARPLSAAAVKKLVGLSSAELTLLPVARSFCVVASSEAVDCSESRFWRTDAERTIPVITIPFWIWTQLTRRRFSFGVPATLSRQRYPFVKPRTRTTTETGELSASHHLWLTIACAPPRHAAIAD